MTVEARIPVIAKHEILPGLQSDGGHRIGDRTREVRLRERLAIDEHPAGGDLDHFTGQSDDPFDADPAFFGQIQDPDLSATRWGARSRVDTNPVSRRERR